MSRRILVSLGFIDEGAARRVEVRARRVFVVVFAVAVALPAAFSALVVDIGYLAPGLTGLLVVLLPKVVLRRSG